MSAQSRRVLYSGSVQGVGFRWTARRCAMGHRVSGYVRNLPDGRVEIQAEGEPAELDAFLGEVRAAMRGYIRNESTQQGPATGGFAGFEIRH